MARTARGLPEIRWPHVPGDDRWERDFAGEAIEALRAAGWYCRQVENQKRIAKGFADWVAIRRGRVVFIEFKAKRGRQRPEQVEFMEQVRAHGGEYRVARVWADVEDIIGRVG